jgi:manganese/zinc/iron transport system ATP- binding protein
MSVFNVSGLSVNYGKTPVLWDISLEIPKGKLVGIIGPNGAGKTTFIKTALGLIQPLSGKVEFFGKSLNKVRQKIAYVPQRESVDWDFPITVRDLVLMGRYGRLGLFRWPRQADIAAALHYLDIVGMKEFASRQISQLSGGQQQRVFIARALMQEPQIYFLDEPFVGIDLASKKVIIDLLKKERDNGKTIFIVHHDLGDVEHLFDWVILLNLRLVGYGEVEKTFTPDAIKKAYGKSYAIFEEALKLYKDKQTGIKS